MRGHTHHIAVPDAIRDPAAFPQAPARAEAHIDPGFHRGSEAGDNASAPCFTDTCEITRSMAKAAAGLPRPTGERGGVRGGFTDSPHPTTLAVPDQICPFYPSPLVGEGAPKGWVRGQCESAKNPLIRPFAHAKAHLLPRGEKGRKEQRPDGQQHGKSRSRTPSPLGGEGWGEGAFTDSPRATTLAVPDPIRDPAAYPHNWSALMRAPPQWTMPPSPARRMGRINLLFSRPSDHARIAA